MGYVAIEVMAFEHAIAWVMKRKENGAGRRVTFGTGVAFPSVVLVPASRSRASTALGHGGFDRGVLNAASVAQGIRGSNH